MHKMPFGAELQEGGAVHFRLWAPGEERVELALEGDAQRLPMTHRSGGWHELVTNRASVGSLYRYFMPKGIQVPDPASRFQPWDVHGPSEVIDPSAYLWQADSWAGRPWDEAVIYELHIGAFTAEGTFRAAIGKLDHLHGLGITAIEIMPVADFAGTRNWGYDGVLLSAPDSSYGRPDDFRALVDAAHARGIMVFLDVVYNHFGPEGNYLGSYAPQFFTDRHQTPWGEGINFDGAESGPIREFVIHNALYWIEEFQLDGLRLDAIHAIRDDSPKHVALELAERVRSQVTTRPIHLLVENDENQPSWLRPERFTAQWNDDLHHALHTAVTSESSGYYSDYCGDTQKLGRALAEGFAFQGEWMPHRGHTRGAPSAHLPPSVFVPFLQNHDQIGNRAFGERIGKLAKPEALRAVAAVYLLLPQVPMLFMGEEWNASQPFLFFCDLGGELAQLVRDGRRREFAHFPEFQDEAHASSIADPQATATFYASKLDWSDLALPGHAEWLAWYRSIIECRHRIAPILREVKNAGRYEVLGEGAVVVRWCAGEHRELTLAANLSGTAKANFPESSDEVVWQQGAQAGAPWSVCWRTT